MTNFEIVLYTVGAKGRCKIILNVSRWLVVGGLMRTRVIHIDFLFVSFMHVCGASAVRNTFCIPIQVRTVKKIGCVPVVLSHAMQDIQWYLF